ncbi:MAG: hypothetical protein K2F79_05880 [Muribaculaceae bacterium]|nr:hypothetical protein [Muribaculaceae bacterium]
MVIYTGEDLRQLSMPELRLHFGKAGPQYYNFARGIDNRPVQPYRERKSVGCERTTDCDISGRDEIAALIGELAEELEGRVRGKGFSGTTLTLKVKYSDFTQLTRCTSGLEEDLKASDYTAMALELMDRIDGPVKPIRLLGLSLSRQTKTDSRTGNPLQLLLDL